MTTDGSDESSATLRVRLSQVVLDKPRSVFLSVQTGWKDESSKGQEKATQSSDEQRTDTSSENETPQFENCEFSLPVSRDLKGSHARLFVRIFDAANKDNMSAEELATGFVRLRTHAEKLSAGEEVSSRVSMGESFCVVHFGFEEKRRESKGLSLDNAAAGLDELAREVTPQKEEVSLPEQFQASLMEDEGADNNSKQEAEAPLEWPECPTQTVNSCVVGVHRAYNMPIADGAVVKASYAGGLDATACSAKGRHPCFGTSLVADGPSSEDKGDVKVAIITTTGMKCSKSIDMRRLSHGRGALLSIPVGTENEDGDTPFRISAWVAKPHNGLSLCTWSNGNNHGGCLASIALKGPLPWQGNSTMVGGTLAAVRLCGGPAEASGEGDEGADIELIELDKDDETGEWGGNSIEEIGEAEDGWTSRQCMILDGNGSAVPSLDFPLDSVMTDAGELTAVVDLFQVPPGEPEDEDSGVDGEVDPSALPEFLGSAAIPLSQLLASAQKHGTAEAALQADIIYSEAGTSVAKGNPGKVWVEVKLMVAGGLANFLSKMIGIEQTRLSDLARFRQFSGEVRNLESNALAKRSKIVRGDAPTVPPTPEDATKNDRPSTIGVARRAARPNQTPIPPRQPTADKPKESARRPNSGGSLSRAQQMEAAVREAEKNLEAKFAIERRDMLARLEELTQDMSRRSRLSERLQVDLDDARIAVRRCGTEITELRRHNSRLVQDKGELQEEIQGMREHEANAVDVDDVSNVSRDELEMRYARVVNAYKRDRERADKLVTRMKEMHKELVRRQDVDRNLKRVEEAHMSQQVQLQKLQEANKRLSKYVQATKDQEQIIQRLESVMGRALQEARKGKDLEAETQMLRAEIIRFRKENESLRLKVDAESHEQLESLQATWNEEKAKLQASLDEAKGKSMNEEDKLKYKAMEDEVQALRAKVQQAEKDKQEIADRQEKGNKAPAKEAPGDWQMERMRLLMRAEKAETRAKKTDETLKENTKKFGKEISGLRMQLMERDAALADAGVAPPIPSARGKTPPTSKAAPPMHASGAIRKRTPDLAPIGTK